jgi:hypothetical protein
MPLESGCIPWRGTVGANGYGTLSVNNKHVYAHRIAYELFKEPIPEGFLVRHSCDNRICVNHEHLLIGTDLENNRDRWERGKPNIGSLHGMSRLSEDEVREARRLRKSGVPLKEVAKTLGIPYQTASSITNGSRWKHMEDI